MDARAKLILLLVFLISLALAKHLTPIALAIYLGYLFAAILFARLPVLSMLKISVAAMPFAGFFAFMLYMSGDLPRAVSILCKTYLSLLAVVVCVSTTPLPKLMQAARLLHAPSFLIDVTQLIYRYLFVLRAEIGVMRTAFVSRGGQAGRRAFTSASGLVAVLFARAYRRAVAVDNAMSSRGFSGVLPAPVPNRLTGSEISLLVFGLLAIIAVRFL